jgi:hypothetical protein
MFRVLVLLGLAADIESGARKNISDIDLIIIFFLVFFGGIIIIIE